VDVATARAAGIAVCAVTWGLTAPDTLREAAPDHVVDRPDELLALAG
jgi:phosphoglycolate phosphatase